MKKVIFAVSFGLLFVLAINAISRSIKYYFNMPIDLINFYLCCLMIGFLYAKIYWDAKK